MNSEQNRLEDPKLSIIIWAIVVLLMVCEQINAGVYQQLIIEFINKTIPKTIQQTIDSQGFLNHMYKTHSSLPKFIDQNRNHSKSLNNFVLLNKNRQVQSNYQWKPLKVNQNLLHRTNSLNRQISFGPSYAHKKSILLTLNQPNQNQMTNASNSKHSSPTKKSISTEVFLKSKLNLNPKQSTQSSDLKQVDVELRCGKKVRKMQSKMNQFTSTTTFFNQKVQNNIQNYKQSGSHRQSADNEGVQRNKGLDERIRQAGVKGQRVLSVLTMKRYGLRIRLKQCFVEVCECEKRRHQNEHRFENNSKMNALVRQMLSISKSDERALYYFDLNKEPLSSSDQLCESESVILASSSPVLNIENEFHFRIYEEAQKINSLIRQVKLSLGLNQYSQQPNHEKKSVFKYRSNKSSGQQANSQTDPDLTHEYDWQKIQNINNFVQQIVENPDHLKTLNINQNDQTSLKNSIQNFYYQKFDTITKPQTGQNFRNPLLQDHSHYHFELSKKQMLNTISAKLQHQSFIKNQHILKRPTIEALIEQDKKQKQKESEDMQNPNIISRNIRNTQRSKKSIIRQLDQKNPLLFQQNIPYLLNKYGINRYEIHNIFTIYKTLQKISAMKYKNQNNATKILNKGIDRSTFDQGMKRLDINPGDQVIKNICYFDDFISWEHFLKIVSIGLRKTPQEKLEAILIGIGGTNNGCLSRNQISLMIGNSLNKIFDSQQSQLREYFTEMAMKDLDSDNSGTVDVQEIKNKCLSVGQINPQNGQNMDLVTFLLLNS